MGTVFGKKPKLKHDGFYSVTPISNFIHAAKIKKTPSDYAGGKQLFHTRYERTEWLHSFVHN